MNTGEPINICNPGFTKAYKQYCRVETSVDFYKSNLWSHLIVSKNYSERLLPILNM